MFNLYVNISIVYNNDKFNIFCYLLSNIFILFFWLNLSKSNIFIFYINIIIFHIMFFQPLYSLLIVIFINIK